MVTEEVLLVLVRRRELQHGDREAVVVSSPECGEGERVVVLVEELRHLVAVQVDLVEAIRPHHDVLLTEIHTATRLARRQLLEEMYGGRYFIKQFRSWFSHNGRDMDNRSVRISFTYVFRFVFPFLAAED